MVGPVNGLSNAASTLSNVDGSTRADLMISAPQTDTELGNHAVGGVSRGL